VSGVAETAVETDVLLQVTGLSKRFGDLLANDDITFTLRSGEVHGLLGENGAGKSTLVKSLYGIHQPDAGEILLGDRPIRIGSPSHARDLGIGMVFQDMRLVPALTVWENVALQVRETPRILKPRQLQEQIARASARYGLEVDPGARVRDLSIGEWQRVELLKVLLAGARVLILDEPTSVLTPQETTGFFEVLRKLTAQGVGVILIAHKIREVREIADRVTVLRAGRAVMSDVDPRLLSDDELVRAMVGTSVSPVVRREEAAGAVPDAPLRTAAITLSDVTVLRPDGSAGLDHVDLNVVPARILGIAGIAGNGQEDLANVLVGMAAVKTGSVEVGGEKLAGAAEFRRAGVVDVVAHPMKQFVVRGMSVAAHAALWEAAKSPARNRFDVRAAFRRFAERNATARLRAADASRRLDHLSGGNIQRVMLTLALTEQADVVVASYPTRGLDVLTTERTHQLILEARDSGSAVVLISEDLDELLALSDTIAVLNHGRVVGVIPALDATRDSLGLMMTKGAA
jgi:general nucleoside transport system ATP-binding protein